MIPEIISGGDKVTITQVSEQELYRRTCSIRDNMHFVFDIVSNGLMQNVSTYIETARPNLVPFGGIRDPLERVITLHKAVAGLALKAAARPELFDLAVYPCAATDLSTASYFADNIVTIDSDDIMADSEMESRRVRNSLFNLLLAKLLDGWYLTSIPKGLTALALDHYLIGTDIETFDIVGESLVTDGDKKMRVTSMRYQTSDARAINQVHFGMFLVRDGPDKAVPMQKILMEQLEQFSKTHSVVLLGKASGNERFSAANPYYAVLPVNTVIVSDTELDEAGLEKAGLTACDLKNVEIMSAIREFQPFPPPEKRSLFSNSENISDYPRFGYLFDLSGITLDRLI